MTNSVGEEAASEAKVRSLKEALIVARNKAADRSESLFDMQAAEYARLSMLADDLRPLMAEIDETDERFEFALTNGERSRLWIDMTSFVTMGQDRKTHRFLKDTRLGRIVLAETADMDKMADIISDYVVDKILERERIMDGEKKSLRKSGPLKKEKATFKRPPSEKSERSGVDKRVERPQDNRDESGRKFGWFLLGIFCCLLLLALGISLWAPEAL